ncbi:MAG: Rab family GTPase [Anaerolineae bacterium]
MVSVSKKVCLLGSFAVGKTSLVRRFVHDRFDDKYISTIGVKVSRKIVTVPRQDDVVEVVMMLWDLAGSEELGALQGSYLRGAAGGLMVCDLTRPDTVGGLASYAASLRRANPNAVMVVAGNKQDLLPTLTESERQQRAVQVDAVANELAAPVLNTSALTGDNVEMAFRRLAELLAAQVT